MRWAGRFPANGLMSRRFDSHEPCPGCGSKDNLARYTDGSAVCYGAGCEYREEAGDDLAEVSRPVADKLTSFTPIEGDFHDLTKRGLTEETCRQFKYRIAHTSDGAVQVADYYDIRGRRCGQKIRYPNKAFTWNGRAKEAGFFGQQRASAKQGYRLYVTEGEIDAMSISQVKGHRWPVVSLKNGASGAAKDFAAQLDWLDQFREVILVFDSDEPGEAAAQQCAELLPHKARIARLPRKDANEMLVAGETAELIEAIDSAAPYRPDGVVAARDLIGELLVKPEHGLSYPWNGLNRLTYGMRLGEITTWCGGTGTGKSQALREVTRTLLLDHKQAVGVIALEETAKFAALGQVSLELETPLHIPERRERVTDEEITAAAERVLENLYLYSTSDVAEASNILPKIRYLVHGLGCRYIVLDHLSIMVSGTATDGDERKRIDEIMTRLRSLTQELDVGIHVICHLRKPNGTPFEEGGQISLVDLRGSGAISQISNSVIALERDQQSDSVEKNMARVRVLKNRFSGHLGVAGRLEFDPVTCRLNEVEVVPDTMTAPSGEEVRDF